MLSKRIGVLLLSIGFFLGIPSLNSLNLSNPLVGTVKAYASSLKIQDGLYFMVSETEATLVHVDYASVPSQEIITIPDYVDGVPVTTINSSVFIGLGINTINLPNTLITIGDQAFMNCSNLVTIAIPDSVTYLGEQAFQGCSSLKDISIGRGVTELKQGTFRDCQSLKNFNMPDTVEILNDQVFDGCSSLESISLSNSITTLVQYALYNCSALKSINIPSSVTSIDDNAFMNCSALISIDMSHSSVVTLGSQIVSGCNSLIEVMLPDTLNYIGNASFAGCTTLQDIEIPSSVISIGDSAFASCINLQKVVINDGVKTIGNGSFAGCISIQELKIPNSVTSIGSTAFGGCTSLYILDLPTNADYTTTTRDGVFQGCSNLAVVKASKNFVDIASSSSASFGNNSATYFKVYFTDNDLTPVSSFLAISGSDLHTYIQSMPNKLLLVFNSWVNATDGSISQVNDIEDNVNFIAKYISSPTNGGLTKYTQIGSYLVHFDTSTPTKPTEPTQPTDPADPTDPSTPTQPTNPTNPTQPSDSGSSSNPDESSIGDIIKVFKNSENNNTDYMESKIPASSVVKDLDTTNGVVYNWENKSEGLSGTLVQVPVSDTDNMYVINLDQAPKNDTNIQILNLVKNDDMKLYSKVDDIGKFALIADNTKKENNVEFKTTQSKQYVVTPKDLPSAKVVNGWFELSKNTWYFFDKYKDTKTIGWHTADRHEWQHNGKDIYGDRFNLSSDGIMDYGWFKDTDGSWYYLDDLDSDKVYGGALSGWYYLDNNWYYFDKSDNCKMSTGWKKIDGNWYFFEANGSMLSSSVVDGYTLDEHGKLV